MVSDQGWIKLTNFRQGKEHGDFVWIQKDGTYITGKCHDGFKYGKFTTKHEHGEYSKSENAGSKKQCYCSIF